MRRLPPPLVRDDVMDLNHELRFTDFWKSTNDRQSDMAVRRMRGRVAHGSGGLPFGICPVTDALGGLGWGAVGDNPQGFLFVMNLQDSSVSISRERNNGGSSPWRDASGTVRSPKPENGEVGR